MEIFEIENLPQRMQHIINDIKYLHTFISLANYALDDAEKIFKDSAFAPFGDTIENAVKNLADVDTRAQRVVDDANHFKQRVVDGHFSKINYQFPALPDGKVVADRLNNMVYIPQRNFQFAMIYEQRKTNKIFTTLSEALDGMSYQIGKSFDVLATEVSGLSSAYEQASIRLAEELQAARGQLAEEYEQRRQDTKETRKREERQIEILDKIQRRERT